MKKFYYAAVYCDVYGDDERDLVVVHVGELKHGDIVVVELSKKFVTATIVEPIDELDIIVRRISSLQVITKVEVKEYLKKKEAIVKRASIIEELEAKSKEVKLLENLKKIATNDEDMQAMLLQLNALDNELKDLEKE